MVQAPVTRLKMQLVGHMLPAATLHQALPEQSLVWPATGGSVICFLGLRGMVLHAEQLHQKLKKKPTRTHTDLVIGGNLSGPPSKSSNTTQYSCHGSNGLSGIQGSCTIQLNKVMLF